MIEFQLFRTKVYPPSQQELPFDGTFRRGRFLGDLLRSRPSAELRKDYVWHVGNVRPIGRGALYFALGRTTLGTISLWDEAAGEFEEEEFETAPYTHAVIDLQLQVCAIARQSRLAPTPSGIARQLERLLNRDTGVRAGGIRVEVSLIQDPETFIATLRRAHTIRSFSAEFSLPNPFDVNKDFQRPLQKYLRTANGTSGKAAVEGEDLDASVLEDVARSAAASGNNAKARLKLKAKGGWVSRILKGNPVSLQQERVETDPDRRTLLSGLRDAYSRVRESDSGESE